MLTDSGGFQVFSLAGCRKLKEEGCHFQSHIDGSRHLFTPESVIDTERTIGADIMMAFDECPPGDSPRDYARQVARPDRALARPLFQPLPPDLAQIRPLPGAVPPSCRAVPYPDLRARAAENVKQYDAGRLCHRRPCRRRADRRDVRDGPGGGECHPPARRPPPAT